jgi:RimJ/RimL family protein N-acetyltransferase
MRLAGNLVVLRSESVDGDDGDMFRWLNMEEWAYYDHPDRPFEPVTREEFDGKVQARASGKAGVVWQRLQIDTADGVHIGWVNCYERDEAVGSTRLGICVADEANWGRGYGTEALALVLEYLFTDRAFHEVRMNTWTGNARMVRAALKAGFEEVSRSPHRAPVSVRGELLERIDLAITRQRWESLAEAKS